MFSYNSSFRFKAGGKKKSNNPNWSGCACVWHCMQHIDDAKTDASLLLLLLVLCSLSLSHSLSFIDYVLHIQISIAAATAAAAEAFVVVLKSHCRIQSDTVSPFRWTCVRSFFHFNISHISISFVWFCLLFFVSVLQIIRCFDANRPVFLIKRLICWFGLEIILP